MKMHAFILSFFLMTGVHAQDNTFEWGDGMTKYIGEFDTTKYSYDDISNIYHYLHTPSSDILTLGAVYTIERMDTVTTIPLDNYYHTTLQTLQTMKIPEGVFWDSLLVCRKRELYEQWQHGRLFIQGLHNPDILLEHYEEECGGVIDALTGTNDELLSAWRVLINRQKRDNMNPERIEREYQEHYRSTNRLKYARLELMKYEWHNCMNRYVYRYDDGDYSTFLQVESEFEKLFVRIGTVK